MVSECACVGNRMFMVSCFYDLQQTPSRCGGFNNAHPLSLLLPFCVNDWLIKPRAHVSEACDWSIEFQNKKEKGKGRLLASFVCTLKRNYATL
ncbi:unnamed protein product [Gadus morhua 'NCC']